MTIPATQVDILSGENRRAPHTERNPMGQLPTLELDGGGCIAEVTAICEYLEDTHPTPSLAGFASCFAPWPWTICSSTPIPA